MRLSYSPLSALLPLVYFLQHLGVLVYFLNFLGVPRMPQPCSCLQGFCNLCWLPGITQKYLHACVLYSGKTPYPDHLTESKPSTPTNTSLISLLSGVCPWHRVGTQMADSRPHVQSATEKVSVKVVL